MENLQTQPTEQVVNESRFWRAVAFVGEMLATGGLSTRRREREEGLGSLNQEASVEDK